MKEKPDIPWKKHLDAVEKHLGKNEKWFQYPEKKMYELEQNMDIWNEEFIQRMGAVEEMIKRLEENMEE